MFGRSSQRVGLDIGTHSIKLVVLEKSGGRFRPVKAVKQDIYPSANNYDSEGPKRSVAVPALSEVFRKAGLNPRKVRNLYSAIGGAQVSAKEISAIHLDDEEMASAMLLEARKHLPLDGTQTMIDYQVLGEDPKTSDRVRVLIVATTKKLFTYHTDLLRDLEMKPGVVDIDQLASMNSYIAERDLPDEGALIFLNIGARKTSLTVFGRKDLFFTRDIPVAGYVFTEELSKKFNIELEKAERLKIEQGMNPDVQSTVVETAAPVIRMAEKNAVERLGDEINRSLRYYVKEAGQSYFTQIVISGGSSALKGMDEMLKNRFNLPVVTHDPLKEYSFDRNGLYGPQFAVAVGLAIRGD